MFRDLLRDSKLFSLPPRSVAQHLTSKDVPRHQVLAAPAASVYRRNWGLKHPVPSAAKTNLVELESFDDHLASNGVDYNPRFARKIQKIESLGEPVTLSQHSRLRSLWDAPKTRVRRSLDQLSEKEFKKLLAKAKAAPRLAPKANASEAISALNKPGLTTGAEFALSEDSAAPSMLRSTIGLTYASSGVFHNTPQGVLEHKAAKGRITPGRGNRVAFGGFLTEDAHRVQSGTYASNASAMPSQLPRDYIVSSIGGSKQGEARISVMEVHNGANNKGSDPFSVESIVDATTNA